jgi:hypothetical protein
VESLAKSISKKAGRIGRRKAYVEPIFRNFRGSHLTRAVLAMLQTGVEVRETLHLHGQMLRYFVQRQQTSLRHSAILEIFADQGSNGASDFLIENGESV